MQLIWLDWLVIALYFLLNIGIGLYYYRKASGSVGDFFISGRQVPWWLAGTSMVATTFGADTPLVVTGIVYRYGIAGNWLCPAGQYHHHGLGEPGDGEGPGTHAGGHQA
jgi:Na+/proline symporter